MTRFARAKGSKASNEKTPENGTPWEVMKEQLLKTKRETDEAKKREEAEKRRLENYANFLKEQKVQKRKAVWCDFPEAENSNSALNGDQPRKKKLKKKQKENNKQTDIPELINGMDETVTSENKTQKKKINKYSTSKCNVLSQSEQVSPLMTKKIKKNKKKPQFVNNKFTKKRNEEPSESTNLTCNNETQEHGKIRISENRVEKVNIKKKNKKSKQINIRETKTKSVSSEVIEDNNNIVKNLEQETHYLKKKKDKKLIDGIPVRRKVINDRSFQLIINGKEMELIRFDGFPIMKKDAQRLEELKNSMIKKGIPNSEVQRTIKLERRKAEKALARVKRQVCYNCRKGGHNLSDCPDLKSKIPGVEAAEGICFKCGSTEHRQFECKVQRGKEFRFASCFICKENGHIARQCPDNPKGLYPKGGCCKVCGDVTHLKKDCPTLNDKKESTSIKLQTLDNVDSIEGIYQNINTTVHEESVKKPKKIQF